MSIADVRRQIHKLVDEADDSTLSAVLEVLQVPSGNYTTDDLNTYYNRIKQFEAAGSKGLTPEESHSQIRSNYKHGL